MDWKHQTPKLASSVLNYKNWLVSIMVITADCLSAYGSSILPRVAKFLQIMDRAGIYWCLILVAAKVRVLWSAPGLCVHLVQVVIKSVRGSVQSAPSFAPVASGNWYT